MMQLEVASAVAAYSADAHLLCSFHQPGLDAMDLQANTHQPCQYTCLAFMEVCSRTHFRLLRL